MNSPRRSPSRAGRAGLILACLLALAAALPAVASASHEQGGYLTAAVTADGHLKGTLAYLTRGSCTVGQTTGQYPLTVTGPLGPTATISTDIARYTRCLPNNTTQQATFDADLASAFGGSAPDGDYTISFSSCCRVNGIVNKSDTNTSFEARVHKTFGQASSAPVLASDVATGVAVGYRYSQFLNASDPDGGALTYSSRAGQPDGPDTDIVSLSSAGEVSIPATTTAQLADGSHYVYKVRVTDAQGEYAERDVLLVVTANNVPPALTGLDSSAPYTVAPGTTRQIVFGASDANNAAPKVDTVSISGAGLPAWATLSTTPNNPASATLTLSPPADLAPTTVGMNFDAVDDDAIAPLTDSANIQVAVAALAAPGTPRITAGPSPIASSASFAFTADDAASFECRVDGGAWTACTSPWQPDGLADGPHAFDVRALNLAGQPSTAAALSWTQDTAAPAAPTIVGAPAARTPDTAGRFEFAGEPGGSFECRLDGGAWQPCASPREYAGLTAGSHTFAVRQTDAAGNSGAERTFSWLVGAASGGSPGRSLAATLPPNATASVHGDTATVGCRVSTGSLESCSVRAYALVDGHERDAHAVTAKSRRVYVGRGVVTAKRASSRLAVDVKLNAAGRRLLAHSLRGVKVLLDLKARTTVGQTLATQRHGRFVPERQLVIPARGTFRIDSALLTPGGRAFLRTVARELRAAKAIACAGHTDAMGPEAYNVGLARRRAAAACGYLRRLGVHAPFTLRSYGSSRPRASNQTRRGRELNRRVELSVRWR